MSGIGKVRWGRWLVAALILNEIRGIAVVAAIVGAWLKGKGWI